MILKEFKKALDKELGELPPTPKVEGGTASATLLKPDFIAPPKPEKTKTTDAPEKKLVTAVDLLMAYLKQEGVEYIFGVPGGALFPLYEALYKDKQIKPVIVKHEEGAAFMADGYARVSGKLGVCCSTTGPGATNMVTGIACAYADSIPVLALTGQTALHQFGKGAVQESTQYTIDIVDMFKSITKSSVMLHSAEKMGDAIRYCLRTALSGRRGPVHISIPVDLMKKPVILDLRPPHTYRVMSQQFDREAVKEVSKYLVHAKKPVILAGNGVNLANANEELKQLAEKLCIPVATTPKGKSTFPENHVLSLGVFGLAGSPQAEKYLLCEDIDVLLVIGSSLGERSTCNWSEKLKPLQAFVQIDIDPKEIGKNYSVDCSVTGDAKTILKELNYEIDRILNWIEPPVKKDLKSVKLFKAMTLRYEQEEKTNSDEIPIKPQRLIKELRNALPSNALLFIDMGMASSWGVHYFNAYEPKTFFANFGLSSMGHAVASCIGAKLSSPDTPVFALVGDGAFAMNGMEVHTAAENSIPVIWVVINNGGLGLINQGEKIMFGGKFNTSKYAKPLNISEIAKGLGAKSYKIKNPNSLGPCFKESLKSKVPVVIDVISDMSENVPFGHRIKLLKNSFQD